MTGKAKQGLTHVDEYRGREYARGIVERIRDISKTPVNIMEICGTHTHAISRYGIRATLPDTIRLISGPGCPVCVTSASDINALIDFTRKTPGVVIATFGDMMKVPGTESSLAEERARGADIRVVYSPIAAVDMAEREPDREVVLYAVGFETTAPTVAATIMEARQRGVENLSVICLHKLTPPAMRALAAGGEIRIDGFICPGHVTAIIGARAYEFLATEFGAPCVVAGFEPVDVLMGLYMLVRQIEAGERRIEIEYDRVVTMDGNTTAQGLIERVFEPADARWRGIGVIPASGLRIRQEFAAFDAERRFDIERGPEAEPPGCRCGEVLRGLLTPPECGLFARSCVPENPVGPCMVSNEGTCAAYYRYRDA